MAGKKIAFTVETGIAASTVKDLVRAAEEYLLDQYDLKVKLADNPAVMALIQKGMKQSLDYAATDTYFDDIVDLNDLEKLFKKEIKDANDKYEAQRRVDEEAAIARQDATAGVLRMHPDKLAEAKKLLKAAGIDATT